MRRGLGLQTLCPHQADGAKAAQRSRGKVSAGATWGDRTIEGGGQGGTSTHDAMDGKAGPPVHLFPMPGEGAGGRTGR